MPVSRAFLHGLPGIGGLSLLCSGGTHKVQPPLTSPHPTFFQDRDQDVEELAVKSRPAPLHLLLLDLDWFFHFCIPY